MNKDELLKRLLDKCSREELVDLVLGAEPVAPPPAAPSPEAAREPKTRRTRRGRIAVGSESEHGRVVLGRRGSKLLVRCQVCGREGAVGREAWRRFGCPSCAGSRNGRARWDRAERGEESESTISADGVRGKLLDLLQPPADKLSLSVVEWARTLGHPIDGEGVSAETLRLRVYHWSKKLAVAVAGSIELVCSSRDGVWTIQRREAKRD